VAGCFSFHAQIRKVGAKEGPPSSGAVQRYLVLVSEHDVEGLKEPSSQFRLLRRNKKEGIDTTKLSCRVLVLCVGQTLVYSPPSVKIQ